MHIGTRRSALLFSTALTSALLVTQVVLAQDAPTYQFDIPSEKLTKALKDVSATSSQQIVFSDEVIGDRSAPALHGSYTRDQALAILLQGSGLQIAISRTGVLMVQPKNAEAASNDGAAFNPSVETVVVTGSRLAQKLADAPQLVRQYDRKVIDRSGQTTVSDFLNTLPQVSTVQDSVGFQAPGSSVRLHGLPLGTTLVLIDGKRVGLPGGLSIFGNIFDLANIPLGVVDRIDVVPVGSSAVYGSDGIAGVVNIVLKKDIDGAEGSVKFGGANGMNTTNADVTWGTTWQSGSFSIVGSVQHSISLRGHDVPLVARGDYTAVGGTDTRYDSGYPGNVFSLDGSNLPGVGAPFAAVPAGFTGAPTQAEFAGTAGTLNKFDLYDQFSLIARSTQFSSLASFHQELGPNVELFAQTLYSHNDVFGSTGPAFLFGEPGFQSYSAGASNPYNPFGEDVGVTTLFPGVQTGRKTSTTYVQSTLGFRGDVLDDWHWEISGNLSNEADRYDYPNNVNSVVAQTALDSADPATALNLFTAGPIGSKQLISSLFYNLDEHVNAVRLGVNGFVQGPILSLPWGSIDVVLGGEFWHDRLSSGEVDPTNPNPPNVLDTATPTVERNSEAAFAEMHIPLLAKRDNGSEQLAVNLAARFDNFSDSGSRTTPQVGILWRPLDEFAIRATWGKAFKAPSLFQLHAEQVSFPSPVFDPATGQNVEVTVLAGGNPKLKPELGESHSIGFEYDSLELPGLTLSASQWRVVETNSIQMLPIAAILENEKLFPGYVTRASACAGGPPCPPTIIEDGYANFGVIDVQGVDLDASYSMESALGHWSAAASASDIYEYKAAFLPGIAPTSRLSKASEDFNWAPHWKMTTTLGWSSGPIQVGLSGRYTSGYRDYEPLSTGVYQKLGDFWLWDLNTHFDLGPLTSNAVLTDTNAYLEIGAINLFDHQPQFSMLFGGSPGYDTLENDPRGRFIYGRLGVKL